MIKYYIDWTESNNFTPCTYCNSLIKAFVEVYGVKQFTIKFGKYRIRGSHFIIGDNYDFGFHYMLSCFLTPKQIIKVYKRLIKY